MSRLGLLFSLIAAIAGFVAAHALALELPPAPGVTVTIPSPPVTTVPPLLPVPAPPPLPVTPPPPVTVPTPPVVTTAPAPQPVAPPIVTTPAPPVVPPTASPPARGPAPVPNGSAGSTAQPGSRSGSARNSRPATSIGATQLRATPRRSKNRVTVRLQFTLSATKRVFLVVRGPVPSCNVVGVIPVRGRRGANTVEFAGRAGGRNLRPGGYLLSISPVRRSSVDASATLVQVVSKRRSVPARAGANRPTCAAAREHRDGTAAMSRERPAVRGDSDTSIPPRDGDQQHDVLGIAFPRPGPDSGDSGTRLESLLTIGVLTLIGAILLTMATLIARFLRGSWNP